MRVSIIVSNTFVKSVFGFLPPSSEHEAKREHKAVRARASLLAYILGCHLLIIDNSIYTLLLVF